MNAARPMVRRLVLASALAVVYFAAARMGLMLDAVAGFATLVWPPTGIALACLLLFGTRLWPAVALGAFAANASVGAAPLVAAGIAVGNTLEAVIGAELLGRLGFRSSFDRIRDVLALVGAIALATLVSASLGVSSLLGGGLIDTAGFLPAWRAWVLGDAIGALCFAPLIWVWADKQRARRPKRSSAEVILLGVMLVAVSAFVFGGPRVSGAAPLQQAYLLFPVLIWAALRFEQRGAVAAMCAASAVAIWGATRASGPFTGETLSARLVLLQAFTGVSAVTVYLLAAATSERRRALQTQEEFLAIVSHDLRSPLTAIEMSAASVVAAAERESLPPVVRRRAEAILRGCARMAALIRDLLDFGAMQRGRLRVERQELDVRRLLDELVSQVQPLVDGKRQNFSLELLHASCHVLADRVRILQALTNLVANAIKFTPEEGTIVIRCEKRDQMVVIAVIDTGPGLAPEEIPHLFEPYWQGRASSQGVGLGLAIARAVAEAHDGQIRAMRNASGGSTFSLSLPLAHDGAAAESAALRAPSPSQP